MGIVSEVAACSPPWVSFAYGVLPIVFVFLFVQVAPEHRRSFVANSFRGGMLWITFVGVVALSTCCFDFTTAQALQSAAATVLIIALLMRACSIPLWDQESH